MPLMVDVFWKRLNPVAKIPQYMSEQASGMDIRACLQGHPDFPKGMALIQPGETVTIPTGLAVAIPEGFELQIRPRSGVSRKSKLRLPNTPGTIDSDYRGEVGVLVENIGVMEVIVIKHDDRIAQCVLAPVLRANNLETDELDETARGSNGYGNSPEEGYGGTI